MPKMKPAPVNLGTQLRAQKKSAQISRLAPDSPRLVAARKRARTRQVTPIGGIPFKALKDLKVR